MRGIAESSGGRAGRDGRLDPAAGAETAVRRGRGGGIPRRVYPARVLGLGLGMCCVAGVLAGLRPPAWVWGALIAHGLAWPHLAYWRARRARRPRRAEYANMIVDSGACGFWIPLMHFNLLPSVLVFAMLGLNSIALGGRMLLLRSLAAHVGGIALGAWVGGIQFAPATGMRELLACLPLLVLYPQLIGGIAYRLARQLDADRRRLLNLSRIDPLTGLWNRAYWFERAAIEFTRCRRHGVSGVMVLADIDHFKRVNDRYGHGAGDAVLGGIAGVLHPELRSGDLLCRYGGEEFAMVLPDTDNAGALVILERLRGIIAETDFAPVFPEALTMSFGVAEWNRALTDPPAWIEAADSALYAAKRRGRNRVVVFGVSGADGTRSRREFFSSRLRDEPSG